ncbi:unnamed protein product, partial [Iphiclides podalirius]
MLRCCVVQRCSVGAGGGRGAVSAIAHVINDLNTGVRRRGAGSIPVIDSTSRRRNETIHESGAADIVGAFL